MARPTVLHQGFFVPNAQDVTKPELAEPDRIDFNTVAHTRWGVISGCLVTVSGQSATNTPGTALVNGKLVQVAGGQPVSVGGGGANDRFDIVGVDDTGKLVGIPGAASVDPVFPDVPLNVTALAAVLCTAGSSSYTDNVIDKRKFLADSLLTKIPPEQDLLVNRNGSGNLFGIVGDGTIEWAGDKTSLLRESEGVLRIIANLKIDNTLVTGGGIQAKSLTATDRILGSNLRTGTALPGTGNTGDIFTNANDGGAYIYKNNAWREIATVESAIPMGCVITSLRPPASMPAGWVPLDGVAQVYEATQLALFTLLDSWGWPKSGQSPNRVITTRSANKRMLMVDFDAAGAQGGSNTIAIGLANLPPHKHNSVVQAGGGYSPVVRVNRVAGHVHGVTGGAHGHNDVPDPGHKHHGMESPIGTNLDVVALFWGGQNKIDAYFNDRSHTFSVENLQWTMPAYTGITYIGSAGSAHQHEVNPAGDHEHTVAVDPVASHPHNVQEDLIGEGTPLPYTPAYLSVFAYIKA